MVSESGEIAQGEPTRLHEAALLVVRVKKPRAEDLRTLRSAIRDSLESEVGESEVARQVLNEAVDIVDRSIEARGRQRAALYGQVIELLDQAIEALDADDTLNTSAPSTGSTDAEQPDSEARAEGTLDTGSTSGEEGQAEALPVLLQDNHDAEMVPEFLTEARELIEQSEQALLQLEETPDDPEAISVVFRCFHTIKGGAAFLGLEAAERFAHAAENILGKMRDGEIRCEGAYAQLCLHSVDCLSSVVEAIAVAASGGDAAIPETYAPLMRDLDRANRGVLPDSMVASTDADSNEPATPEAATDLPSPGPESPSAPESASSAPSKSEPSRQPEGANAKSRTPSSKSMGSMSSDGTLRVRTERLDRLIDMVGELVIANAMVAEDEAITAGAYTDLRTKVAHLVKLTRELHDLSMSMRMVPLRATFRKMTRVVRDVAQKRGRKVRLVTAGEETEIDRNMVDVIGDPLVHMVRNAVDHGVESPEERRAAGKDPDGSISLSAYHASGNIVIELSDDGAGIDRDAVVKKATARGLIDSDAGMSDSEVFALIFEAGFSTAEKVTEVSGRGVGMDVVRRNIEALRGRIDIESTLGVGTRFTIRLPLTLAVSDGMLLLAGSERYIVPIHHVVESFCPDGSMLHTFAERGEMVRLRDKLLPLIRLGSIFGVPGIAARPEDGLLVVLRGADGHFALLVDELLGQQQVVVKTLEQGLGLVPGVAGAAILGDGQVGLIIEPEEIANLALGGSWPAARDESRNLEVMNGGV